MRECHGLVDALVTYINHALDVGKCEDKVRRGGKTVTKGAWGFLACSEHVRPPERGECCVCTEKPVLPPVR